MLNMFKFITILGALGQSKHLVEYALLDRTASQRDSLPTTDPRLQDQMSVNPTIHVSHPFSLLDLMLILIKPCHLSTRL